MWLAHTSAMARENWPVEHLLRRAAFGPTAADVVTFAAVPVSTVIDYLLDYERQPDDVDSKIGQSDYVSVTAPGRQFSPNTNIEDARQRWLFRMVHSQRPLQEKMALFWHNHFATAYSKIAGALGGVQATKMMALASGELPGPPGQIELFRRFALGSFRDLLVEVAGYLAILHKAGVAFFEPGEGCCRGHRRLGFGGLSFHIFTYAC